MAEANALVVGYGSIGKRHHTVLTELGCQVAVVSRRPDVAPLQFDNVSSALAEWNPDYVVIASRTSEHMSDLAKIADAGFSGKVLVEKPIFDCREPVPQNVFSDLRVGFNLRCHALFAALMDAIKGETIWAVHGYVGQYLPDWRPDQDYRKSYSANGDQGGGVLLDLSHDLDIMAQLTGPWQRLTALGGKISSLEITSDDCFSLLMTHESCLVATLTLNYLDRTATRNYVIHGDGFTLRADFVAGTLDRNGTRIFEAKATRNVTYEAMHRRMLAGTTSSLCTDTEALELLSTSSAVRAAAETGTWIHNA